MAIGQWKVLLFETRTGWIVDNDLAVLAVPTFGRRINSSSPMQAVVLVGDSSTPDARTLDGLTQEWRYSLAVDIGGYIAAFGPITDSDFDDSSGHLTIGCGDMWSLLNRRELINPATPPTTTTAAALLPMDSTRDLVYTAVSKSDIAVRLVSDSCSRTGYDLPIDYPALTGGTQSRTYPIYDIADVGERLMDLSREDGGPDIDWQAHYDPAHDGYIRYEMRVGSPLLGQSGAPPIWDYGSTVTKINVKRDGTNLVAGAGGVYVKGNGTERSAQIAYTSAPAALAAWPALDAVDSSHSSETDAGILQGYATADATFDGTTTVTWTCTARLDAGPVPSDYLPGTTVVINVRGHRSIADGTYTQRVLGMTDNQSAVGTVRPILQAIQVAP